jgi:putative membrane protein
MQKRIKILAGSLFILSSLQFSSVYAEDMQNNMTPSETAMGTPATPMTDVDILAMLMTVNADELDAGMKAEAISANKKVKQFANMMINHHNNGVKKVKKFEKGLKLNDPKTDESIKMHNDNMAEMTRVMAMHGSAFDKAYMDMMVSGHKKVLDLLDKRLIPSTKDKVLKEYLKNTRITVNTHLAMAEKIRKGLV